MKILDIAKQKFFLMNLYIKEIIFLVLHLEWGFELRL